MADVEPCVGSALRIGVVATAGPAVATVPRPMDDLGEVGDDPGGPESRGRRRRPRRRTVVLAVLALVVGLALPVPWRLHATHHPAHAWQLDGRLTVQGAPIDPPGTWSWLTAGRPPLVAEVLMDKLDGAVETSVDVRRGPPRARSAVVVPVAAATGLEAAGDHGVGLGIRVEASGARDARYPDEAVLTQVNGIDLTDRRAWSRASSQSTAEVSFRLADGSTWQHDAPTLPWTTITVIDVVASQFDAKLFGNLPDLPPIRWAREQLALGPSHGLMVAVTTWADATGLDLAGVHVAGTGGIRGDGRVTPIGSLQAKAGAARAAGVDVFFYPVVQAVQLAEFEPGPMHLVGVASLDEATVALRNLAAGRDPEVTTAHLEVTAGADAVTQQGPGTVPRP